MAILAHKFNYKFEEFRINLCGSMSSIQLRYPNANTSSKVSKDEKYPLFHSIAGNEDKFNTALSYLLKCLDGLMKAVSNQPDEDKSSMFGFYGINADQINGSSIKYKNTSSDSTAWT